MDVPIMMSILYDKTGQNTSSCAFTLISSSTRLNNDYLFKCLNISIFSAIMNNESNICGLVSQIISDWFNYFYGILQI